MAGYGTPITMVNEFFEGATKSRIKRRSLYIDLNGESGPGLYSYGNHYPVMLDTSLGLWVNVSKTSVTTATQRNGVIAGLRQLGYRPIGRTVVDPVSKCQFEVYAPAQG